MENHPSGSWLPRKQYRGRMNMKNLSLSKLWMKDTTMRSTHHVSPHRTICSIWRPTCRISPIATDKTSCQPLWISLAALYGKIEALHVFFQLWSDRNGAGHGSEGYCMGFAPPGWATISCECIIGWSKNYQLATSMKKKRHSPFNKVKWSLRKAVINTVTLTTMNWNTYPFFGCKFASFKFR